MVFLNRNKYGAPYFGDVIESGGLRHDAGYSDYLGFAIGWKERLIIQKFLTRHNIPKNVRILELGASIGFMGKVATEEGYTNWTCVDWSDWCKRHEVFTIIEEDALVYLNSIPDNSYPDNS